MRPGFSEFSYGFALINELVERWRPRLRVAPIFPSLRQEGSTGGGYDVALRLNRPGLALFLQFKVSEHLTRNSAWESKEYGIPAPFFRFPLRTGGIPDQHQLLLALSQTQGNVFYVAPALSSEYWFNEAFRNGTIARESAWIRPKAIGPVRDNAEHRIVFSNARAPYAYLCSEPQPVSITAFETLHQGLLDALHPDTPPLGQRVHDLEEFLTGLAHETQTLALQEVFPPTMRRGPDILGRLAWASTTVLDCALLIIQRQDERREEPNPDDRGSGTL